MNDDLVARLKKLDIEDMIWFILIGIIILSFYANEIERDYLIFVDKDKKYDIIFVG